MRRDQEKKLIEACRVLLATRPAFRSRPIGAPHSPARLEQQDAIAAEDALLAILAEVERK